MIVPVRCPLSACTEIRFSYLASPYGHALRVPVQPLKADVDKGRDFIAGPLFLLLRLIQLVLEAFVGFASIIQHVTHA